MHQSLSLYAHIDPTLLREDADTNSDADRTVRAEKLRSALDDDEGLWALVSEEDNRIGFVFKKGQVAPVETGGVEDDVEDEVRAKVDKNGGDQGLPIVLD